MKRRDPHLLMAVGAAGLALALWLALLGAMLWSTLDAPASGLLQQRGADVLALLALAWALGLALLGWALYALHSRYVQAPRRFLEATRVLLAARSPQPLTILGTVDQRSLAEAVNSLAAQRDALRADMTTQVTQASAQVQQEKDRLGALMAELPQSVVVCNVAGRILLYNQKARALFLQLSGDAALGAGVELIGICRPIQAVLNDEVLAHAHARIRQAIERGEARPAAQCVTALAGAGGMGGAGGVQLLRVQVSPVQSRVSATAPPHGVSTEAPLATDEPPSANEAPDRTEITGFVLMLDTITARVEDEQERGQLLHGLTEGSCAALANIQTAVDMLAYPDIAPAMRERFLAVVREEVAALSARTAALAQRGAQQLENRWPLEDMRGSDLVAAAAHQMNARCGCPVTPDGVDAALWLRVDSYALLQALAYLGTRLVDEFGVRFLQLRLVRAGAYAQLDLVWSGQAMSNETVMGWEMDSMYAANPGGHHTPLSVREVLDRHGGEMWFERERARHQALFRFLLPLAAEAPAAASSVSAASAASAQAAPLDIYASRPEFYDFDLFQHAEHGGALEDQLLTTLTYTVFDTETTGLHPAQGDAIVQIGAVRVVNGRLLPAECMDQLVNPGRSIPAASIPIHGITDAMVAQQPTIAQVLPALHAFAKDTVLVAHNAAFDMKFLQLWKASTGIVFRQPVLDTLLLSAAVNPHQPSHRLEALAERFGIDVVGRHTALGDAQVTAQVWLRLIPLLAEQGIHTLGQAREAAQKTYYARLKY